MTKSNPLAMPKIGVAIPCHVRDKPLLSYCLNSILALDPKQYALKVDLNKGEDDLKTIRTRLFDDLFRDCEVVLSCDADFWLFPGILKYVSAEKVVSFTQLEKNLSDIPLMLLRTFYPRSWSGLYSLPKREWERIKGLWDGTDTSVKKLCSSYHFVKRPLYYALRSSRDKPLNFQKMNLIQRIKFMAKRPHAQLRGL